MYVLATVMEEDARRARGGAILALQQVSDALSIQVLWTQNGE